MTKMWRPDEDEFLRAGYAEGLSCTEIARRMGRSVNGVWGRACRLGLRHTADEYFESMPAALPTLEYVPHIEIKLNSKYQMRAAP